MGGGGMSGGEMASELELVVPMIVLAINFDLSGLFELLLRVRLISLFRLARSKFVKSSMST